MLFCYLLSLDVLVTVSHPKAKEGAGVFYSHMRVHWHHLCLIKAVPLRSFRAELMTTPMNVLIIDDDSTVSQSLGQALAIENHRVVSAANSREAMRTFCENKIDIVLLDLNLGPESGWDIFRHLTAIKPLVPVIIITGEIDPHQPSGGRSVDALVPKPVNLPVLFQLLRKFAPEPTEKPSLPEQRQSLAAL